MRLRVAVLVAGLAGIAAADETFTVRHARNWQPNAVEGRCEIRVLVDGEADIALMGETLTIRTLNGEPVRDAGSECTTPFPRNAEDVRFRGIDGRGDVRLLEDGSGRNRGAAVVRIRDGKAGAEEYRYRLEWGRGSSFGGGNGGNGGGGRNTGDLARMRTRDLRREIERIFQDTGGRRPSTDTVDDYIDRVRMDRWSLEQVRGDIARQR